MGQRDSFLADEDCNGRDEDCDGVADEGLPTLVYYPDADSDGFGDAGHEGTVDCAPPEIGWVATHGDCDDADNAVHPSATETCDGVDQDCDGHIDDGLPSATWYEDADGDGYGVAGSKGVYDCAPPDPTWVEDAGDCDDEDPGVHPDQVDGCDGVDTDCDGQLDDEGYEEVKAPGCEVHCNAGGAPASLLLLLPLLRRRRA